VEIVIDRKRDRDTYSDVYCLLDVTMLLLPYCWFDYLIVLI